MRTIEVLIATATVIGAAALAAPAAAQAQPRAAVIADAGASDRVAQPAQDFSAQQRRSRTYTPRPTPRRNTAPRYIYPGSRDALDTCAFC